MMVELDRDWNERYLNRQTPWDSGQPSQELQQILDQIKLTTGRALELGCGTGTNAVFLAQSGFEVTAIDVSEAALIQARQRAQEAGIKVNFREADVQNFGAGDPPVDLLFDRGCYHCCRNVDLPGYQRTLENVSKPGMWFLCLCGNANEVSDYGPPRVTEQEIRAEFSPLFEIVQLREFHFEDADRTQGPLGWSVLMRR